MGSRCRLLRDCGGRVGAIRADDLGCCPQGVERVEAADRSVKQSAWFVQGAQRQMSSTETSEQPRSIIGSPAISTTATPQAF